MRIITATAAALGLLIMLVPARADLRECGSIREPGERMTCLERNIAALSAELETVTRDLRRAMKALDGRMAAAQATLGRFESVNIMSNAPEHRCLLDDRNGGITLDSCSASRGWKVSPR